MKKSNCAAVVSGKICKKPFWSRVVSRNRCSRHIEKSPAMPKDYLKPEKNYGAVKSIAVSLTKEKKGKKK